jgi:hypothetical protein
VPLHPTYDLSSPRFLEREFADSRAFLEEEQSRPAELLDIQITCRRLGVPALVHDESGALVVSVDRKGISKLESPVEFVQPSNRGVLRLSFDALRQAITTGTARDVDIPRRQLIYNLGIFKVPEETIRSAHRKLVATPAEHVTVEFLDGLSSLVFPSA